MKFQKPALVAFVFLCMAACQAEKIMKNTLQPSYSYDWTTGWTKQTSLFYFGQRNLLGNTRGYASDPTVIKDGATYRMFYTGYDQNISSVGGSIVEVTSSDATNWEYVNQDTPELFGRVVAARPDQGKWDENLETAEIVKFNGTYYLYYTGYSNTAHPQLGEGYPAYIGLARSSDGVNFERYNNGNIVVNSGRNGDNNWYDRDKIASPSIVEYNNNGTPTLFMVYAAHCYGSSVNAALTDCTNGSKIVIVGATSTDGVNWTKLEQPILLPTNNPEWGVAEPGLVKDPSSNTYYLYYTLIISSPAGYRRIGVASSASIEGPYEIQNDEVLIPEAGTFADFDTNAVIAPHVIVDNAILRMWYIEKGPDDIDWAIGHATSGPAQ